MDKAEYAALAAFRHALRRFLHFSDGAARQAGMTPQQYQALVAIRGFANDEEDTLAIGELAKKLILRPHSAGELVDRLEAHGLAERRPAKADRRIVCVAITSRGHDLLNQLAGAHHDELRRVEPELRRLLRQFASVREAESESGDSRRARRAVAGSRAQDASG